MASVTTMRASVYRVIRDSAQTFITPADILEWLNEAQLDIAIRCKLLGEEVVAQPLAAAATTIALPAGYVEPISLRIGTDSDVEWVDDDVFNSWKDSGDNPGHYLGRIFKANIEIYPGPETATTYTFRYYERPTTMDDDADLQEIPEELVPKMVKYAQAHAKYKEQEIELADRYLEIYERGLPPAPNAQTRTKPGPMNIGYTPSAWDVVGSHRG